jgi:uncharacterized membrane protein YeaQ/YmgE (transglycosylase-associated protein family)
MSLFELLLLMLVAGIIGAVAKSLAGFSHIGCLASIVLGFIGGLLGVWIPALTGLPVLFVISVGGVEFPIIWSIAGAAVFVGILGWLVTGRYGRKHLVIFRVR